MDHTLSICLFQIFYCTATLLNSTCYLPFPYNLVLMNIIMIILFSKSNSDFYKVSKIDTCKNSFIQSYVLYCINPTNKGFQILLLKPVTNLWWIGIGPIMTNCLGMNSCPIVWSNGSMLIEPNRQNWGTNNSFLL